MKKRILVAFLLGSSAYAQSCPQTIPYDQLIQLEQGQTIQTNNGTLVLASKGKLASIQSSPNNRLTAILKDENLLNAQRFSCVYDLKDASDQNIQDSVLKTNITLTMVFIGNPNQAKATEVRRHPPLDETKLKVILEKFKFNDPITSEETQIFNTAVEHVKNKIQEAGGKMTTLTTIESLIKSQARLNEVTPTLQEILENGKKFKWGLDLDLVDKRRHTVRSQNISAEDVTNYITMLQKVINSPTNPAYKVNYDRVKRITKLSDEQLKSLPDLETGRKGQEQKPASSSQVSAPKSGKEGLLEKAKLDRNLSVNKCKCLAGLLEVHIKSLPEKKGMFSRGVYTQTQAYDLVNVMKIEANKTLTQVNKEISYFEHLTFPSPIQENAFKIGMQEQLRLLDMNCSKHFTDLSKIITKISKNTTLYQSQCNGLQK